jgi:hypothetical protein
MNVMLFFLNRKVTQRDPNFTNFHKPQSSREIYFPPSVDFCDTMGERMGRIGRIHTDFFWIPMPEFQAKKSKKKSVSICPIRPIRSPIVSQSSNPY